MRSGFWRSSAANWPFIEGPQAAEFCPIRASPDAQEERLMSLAAPPPRREVQSEFQHSGEDMHMAACLTLPASLSLNYRTVGGPIHWFGIMIASDWTVYTVL